MKKSFRTFVLILTLLFVSTLVHAEIKLNNMETVDLAKYYRPVAPWTGLLIMPDNSEREPDGSVFIQVRNSPRKELIGKILRLRWINSTWFDIYRQDVNISSSTSKKEKKNNLTLPYRLNGLKKVSALESLAGARLRDITEVIIKKPAYRNNSLYIESAPVQIIGTQHALVKFIDPANGDMRKIIHYNPKTGEFDHKIAETVKIPETNLSPNGKDVVTSTVGIENSSLNDAGWYAYGQRIDGVFCINALAPRKIFQINADITVAGKKDVKHYFGKVLHKNLFTGLNKRVEMLPDASFGFTNRANPWKLGAKGFVVHMFGKCLRPGSKMPKFSPGHISFGFAEVVTDPFTGQLRFQIEYKQVYGHTTTGIVAGSSMWHCFLGNLDRGRMYALPVVDTMIKIPEMAPYNINGWIVSPYEGLQSELERMMAIYRTGGGTGISNIRLGVSCVQDSNCALYASLVKFTKKIKNNPKTQKWLVDSSTDKKEVQRFENLISLVKLVKDKLTTFGLLQSNWKNFHRKPLATRQSGKVKDIINALTSIGTVFPRRSNDTLLRIGANRGYPMWSIYTVNIGGIIEGLRPIGPQSLLLR